MKVIVNYIVLLRMYARFVLFCDERGDVGFSDNQLEEFAAFLYDGVLEFYKSREGKAYYKEWLKDHPEYAENLENA